MWREGGGSGGGGHAVVVRLRNFAADNLSPPIASPPPSDGRF